MTNSSTLPDIDVAIIGGGVSGLYTGWRLLTRSVEALNQPLRDWAQKRANGKLKVAIYEGSDRVGGRLLSGQSPHMPDAVCELGGMRYVDPAHTRVQGLIDEFKLSTHVQDVYDPSNFAFLRGNRLRFKDLANPGMLPFNFSGTEADLLQQTNATPGELITQALLKQWPEIAKLRGQKDQLRGYLQNKADLDDTPLEQWGFWNLLLRLMSGEAYKAARDTIGYDVLGANYNAADMISEFFEFAAGIKYRMLDRGFEILPWTLREKFEENEGKVETGAWLRSFDYDRDNGEVSLHFFGRDRSAPVSARSIVLAMPRRSIELLLPECELLSEDAEFQGLLGAVAPIPLYKMFLIYETPWWQNEGVKRGRSLTDLPMRQCYYWAVSGKGNGGEIDKGPAAIMVYNDALNVSFWSALHTQARSAPATQRGFAPAAKEANVRLHPLSQQRRAVSEKFASRPKMFERTPPSEARGFAPAGENKFANHLGENWNDSQAGKHAVTEVERQLLLLHGVDKPSAKLDAAFANWSQDPYGGGVHLWNVGFKSSEVLEKMTKPIEDLPCYICGEAYSTNQTWVEGALQTADLVLDRLGRKPSEKV